MIIPTRSNTTGRWQNIIVVFIAFSLFLLWLLVFQYAKPMGGADMGRLLLAGATSILVENDYTVTQRPPFYSYLLAALGYVQGIDKSKTVTLARDLGNVEGLQVAQGFREVGYRRSILLFQGILWMATLLLVLKISQSAGLSSAMMLLLFLMTLIPSSWIFVLFIHDAVLSQLLLVAGICGFALSIKEGLAMRPLVVAGICFGLSGLSRSTFQLLPIFLILILSVPILRNYGTRKYVKFVVVVLIPWVLLVGSWSVRNYNRFGFFGVSSVLGSALCTKTTNFLEKAQPFFPDVVPAFLSIRQEKGDRWGGQAVKWLMMNKAMTYIQANQLLARVNLKAILSSPILYSYEVAQSLLYFHLPYVPRWPLLIRTPALAAEALLILCFLVLTILWCGFHILSRISPLVHRSLWTTEDSLIACVQSIYWYTAFISSAIDFGKPEHRAPVELLIPLAILLIAHRLQIGKIRTAALGK
jgi:hypothetical protein